MSEMHETPDEIACSPRICDANERTRRLWTLFSVEQRPVSEAESGKLSVSLSLTWLSKCAEPERSVFGAVES